MDAPVFEVRPAQGSDLARLAAMVARLNSRSVSQSLHCSANTPASVRAALFDPENFPDSWDRSFVVAQGREGEITAALGCQFDSERTISWLWGPWLDVDQDWRTRAGQMLDALVQLVPRSVRRIEAFLHVDNRPGFQFFEARGFSPGLVTHIYTVPRSRWTAQSTDTISPLPPLRTAHEVGFTRLHSETFPAGRSTPAEQLIAGRDGEHEIFAAADGLRLLGYVCVSVNHAPREGFIEYLAVKPQARGRGIGARLLQTALHWTFEQRGLPQAALCVSEWRGGARRLYEGAGFGLFASGISMRLAFHK